MWLANPNLNFSNAWFSKTRFSSSSFSSNFGNFSGGTSTRTVTTIINGKKVTKTEKTYTNKDGQRVTEITENDGTNVTTKQMIGDSSNKSSSNQINNYNGNFGNFYLIQLKKNEKEKGHSKMQEELVEK